MFSKFLVLASVFAYALSAVPLLHTDSKDVIPGEYLVQFRSTSSEVQRNVHMGKLAHLISNVGTGKIAGNASVGNYHMYFGTFNADALNYIRLQDDLIELVEANQVFRANQACYQQTKDVEWNLQRVNEESPNYVDPTFRTSHQGEGTLSYIIDTGIYLSSNDYTGRVSWGTNTVDSINDDCQGHGTHVASTVGGSVWGVAKKTTLIAVKVLGCNGSGSTAGVIQGITWSANDRKSKNKPGIANLSLGGGKSSSMRNAINQATADGLVVVVAAGNENQDACNVSPADSSDAITVGSTAQGVGSDSRSSFSNYGECVNIFAPGSSIKAAWIGSPSAVNTISGTSMASPHVAGAAALYLGENPSANPVQVANYLSSVASKDYINFNCGIVGRAACQNSPNEMLFVTRCS